MTRKRWFILIVSCVFLAGAAKLFNVFLAQHEKFASVNGIAFQDPVMNALPLLNVSVFIFSITYGSILLYIFLERRKAFFLERAMVVYAGILLLRIVTLSLLPLRPPEDLIFLEDPFLNELIYPGRIVCDLFFSGHVGLLMAFFFLSKRWVFAALALVLGTLLMVQRVHYSIDVLAAVPFTFIIVLSVEKLLFKRLSTTI
ncbi:MAG: hypothetical protein A3D92_18170 [Bacteroidetes bacterium RIFCSPHIGHO2_02_FULL_44_7]|nr:MAG: hypothetical protein A3D92_18170 [Bacteroidetes bacterium RIFCSPHIGHO2_02_FULL_44_7]